MIEVLLSLIQTGQNWLLWKNGAITCNWLSTPFYDLMIGLLRICWAKERNWDPAWNQTQLGSPNSYLESVVISLTVSYPIGQTHKLTNTFPLQLEIYQAFIEEVLRQTSEDHIDYRSLGSALEAVQDLKTVTQILHKCTISSLRLHVLWDQLQYITSSDCCWFMQYSYVVAVV